MKVTVRAVKDLAANAGFTEEFSDRYLDEMTAFVFAVAKRERKWCYRKLKHWMYDGSIVKPHLLDVFKDAEEDDHLSKG